MAFEYPVGSTISYRYKVISKIGSGSFSTVFKVEDTEPLVDSEEKWKALKVIRFSERTETQREEARILRVLDHPGVVRLYDSYEINAEFHMVIEFCDGMDLHQFIQSYKEKNEAISENTVILFAIQMLEGLQYIHSRNMIIRDIKPRNILVCHEKLKFGDFGVACQLKYPAEQVNVFVGTPQYMSPEMVNSLGYGQKTDIWSFGCVLYEIVQQQPAFEGDSMFVIFNKIITSELPTWPDNYSEVFERALTKDPGLRPTAEELLGSGILQFRSTTSSRNSDESVDEASTVAGGSRPIGQSGADPEPILGCSLHNTYNIVNFIVKQKKDNTEKLFVACSPRRKTGRNIAMLMDRGYSEGPMESNDIKIAKGRTIWVTTKMDIKFVIEGEECEQFEMKFYSNRDYVGKEGWLTPSNPNMKTDPCKGFVVFSMEPQHCYANGNPHISAAGTHVKLCSLPVTFQPRGGEKEMSMNSMENTKGAPIPLWNPLVPFKDSEFGEESVELAKGLQYTATDIAKFQENRKDDFMTSLLMDYFNKKHRIPDMMSRLITTVLSMGHSDIGQMLEANDPRAKAENTFLRIADHLCDDGNFLIDYRHNLRMLGLSDGDVQDLTHRYRDNLKEIVRQGVLLWRSRQPAEAPVQQLVTLLAWLENNRHVRLAETISLKFLQTG